MRGILCGSNKSDSDPGLLPPRLPNDNEHEIPSFPLGTTFRYVAEGRANVVFSITVPAIWKGERQEPITVPPEFFDDKLLRVRKAVQTTVVCETAQMDWQICIKPLFEENQIVDQRLIDLRQGNVIQRLNAELKARELDTINDPPKRPTKRRNIYLADDIHGLLVTDMRAKDPHSYMTIEFKPKWLLQSPSAPSKSKRCRTCAKAARDNNGRATDEKFCPLRLFSRSKDDRIAIARLIVVGTRAIDTDPEILSLHEKTVEEVKTNFLAEWLGSNTLLHRLKKLQKQHDPTFGPQVSPVHLENKHFLIAMTLRDCSVFLRFHFDTKQLEARIGDLDLKSPLKKNEWQRCESELINEGWYTGTEVYEAPLSKQPDGCKLNDGFISDMANKLKNVRHAGSSAEAAGDKTQATYNDESDSSAQKAEAPTREGTK